MKKLLIILFLSPFITRAQFQPGSSRKHSYVSPGEYGVAGYDSVTKQAMNTLNVIPQAFSGQPTNGVQIVQGGVHDSYVVDTLGVFYAQGSNEFGQDGFGNTSGVSTLTAVTTDSAGNTLPPTRQVLPTGNNGTDYLCTFILSTVATGGVVNGTGGLQNGMRGNGTSGAEVTKFVKVVMPGGTNDTVVKIEGQWGIIALTTKDSIIGWGSSIGNTPSYIHLPTGWKAYDIGSNGIAFWALATNGSTHGIFSWSPIFVAEPVYQGQGFGGTSHSSPTRVDQNVFFAGPNKMMNGSRYPTLVTCDNEVTYFICNDGTLWDVGGNAVGDIGNGKQTHFATYSTPYAWDQGLVGGTAQDTIYQDTVYNVAPGITDWDTVYTGFSNSWSVCAMRQNGVIYQWGRNKGSQVWNGQIDCDYTNGNVRASYPDFLNVVWPDSISWPGTAINIQQTFCPYCILNPSGYPCNLCTYNSASPPTVSASNQTLDNGVTSTRISCSASAASSYYINSYSWTQLSGNQATIQFPGMYGTLVSNITSTSTFQVTVTDNNQRTASTTITITVGSGVIGPIPQGSKINVVSTDTIHVHSILAPTTGFYIVDTLTLPVNSCGIFDLFFSAYDTIQKYTGMGEQKIFLSRIGSAYQAPYVSYNSPYISTGLPTHQVYYVVLMLNGLILVQVSGYGAADPIRWNVIKEQRITSL